MTGERARLFVALELPDAAREALVDWRREALGPTPGLRLVAAGSLHLTLCFLGSQEASAHEPIAAACERGLAAAGRQAPPLAAGMPVWLPRRRPAVVAIGIEDPTGGLTRTRQSLAAELAGGGWFESEGRPFLPHVTVARVGRGTRMRASELPAPAPLAFAGREVVLYRSTLLPTGARYEPLRTWTLEREAA
ncbi:MAG TPA: RNA 2',3'-cyclic phosphodiesterase [Solirubrobacteraceae bacterium]|nr:RNA 2',3'-cyclic phosphodiesterase [Solirubrobacteraceae bacterium]